MKIISLGPVAHLSGPLADKLSCPHIIPQQHQFPDGEHYLRMEESVRDDTILVVAGLYQPDSIIFPLIFLAGYLREQEAKNIILVAPYLTYMRQDIAFKPGEIITSKYFARLISQYFDGLITVDPHLHRYDSLDEIYSIPSRVVHANSDIASWIAAELENPVIIGPDEESAQWAEEISQMAHCPVSVLRKVRHGDRDVEISVDDLNGFSDHQPVLVDDIISTGRTLVETSHQLRELGLKAPVCIGVHALLAGDAENALNNAPIARWLTTNTVADDSNQIDISNTLAAAVQAFVTEQFE